jgi:hypothetical protein
LPLYPPFRIIYTDELLIQVTFDPRYLKEHDKSGKTNFTIALAAAEIWMLGFQAFRVYQIHNCSSNSRWVEDGLAVEEAREKMPPLMDEKHS